MSKDREVYRARFARYTPSDLHGMVAGSLIKSEALIEELWVSGRMPDLIEFHGDKLELEIARQISFLQSFLKTINRQRTQKRLR